MNFLNADSNSKRLISCSNCCACFEVLVLGIIRDTLFFSLGRFVESFGLLHVHSSDWRVHLQYLCYMLRLGLGCCGIADSGFRGKFYTHKIGVCFTIFLLLECSDLSWM